MKGRNLIFIALLAIIVGIVLILSYRSIQTHGVVITGGVLFILGGLINVIVFGHQKDRDVKAGRSTDGRGPLTSAINWVSSVGAVILGVCMLIFQDTFAALIPAMFGILIAFTAIYQLYVLAYGTRPVMLPGWLYIAPLALAGAAVYLFLQKPVVDDSAIMLATGISIAFFGLATLIEGIMLGSSHRATISAARKAEEASQKPEAEPAKAPVASPKPLDQADASGASDNSKQ